LETRVSSETLAEVGKTRPESHATYKRTNNKRLFNLWTSFHLDEFLNMKSGTKLDQCPASAAGRFHQLNNLTLISFDVVHSIAHLASAANPKEMA
jgi:hypothetical protein